MHPGKIIGPVWAILLLVLCFGSAIPAEAGDTCPTGIEPASGPGHPVSNDPPIQVNAVHLGSMIAIRIQSRAQISWTTSSAGTDIRFNIWRGHSEADRERCNRNPIVGLHRGVWFDPAPPPRATLYWLEEITSEDTSIWFGPVALAVAPGPAAAELDAPWPNPFNPTTTIGFECREAGQVQLVIYDLSGRQVAVLVDDRLDTGHYTADWNGRDTAGRVVAAGQYLVCLETAGGIDVQKVILAK